MREQDNDIEGFVARWERNRDFSLWHGTDNPDDYYPALTDSVEEMKWKYYCKYLCIRLSSELKKPVSFKEFCTGELRDNGENWAANGYAQMRYVNWGIDTWRHWYMLENNKYPGQWPAHRLQK